MALPSDWSEARSNIDEGTYPSGAVINIVSLVLLLGWIGSVGLLVSNLLRRGTTPDAEEAAMVGSDNTGFDGSIGFDGGVEFDEVYEETEPHDTVSDAEIVDRSPGGSPVEPPMIVPVRAYYFARAEDTLRSISAQFLQTPRRWEELRALNVAGPGVADAGPDTVLPTGTALALPGDPLPWGKPDPVYLWTLAEKFLFTAWGREPTPEEVVPFWRGLTSGSQLDAGDLAWPEHLAAPESVKGAVTSPEPEAEPQHEPATAPEAEPQHEPATAPEAEPQHEPATAPEAEPQHEPATAPEAEPAIAFGPPPDEVPSPSPSPAEGEPALAPTDDQPATPITPPAAEDPSPPPLAHEPPPAYEPPSPPPDSPPPIYEPPPAAHEPLPIYEPPSPPPDSPPPDSPPPIYEPPAYEPPAPPPAYEPPAPPPDAPPPAYEPPAPPPDAPPPVYEPPAYEPQPAAHEPLPPATTGASGVDLGPIEPEAPYVEAEAPRMPTFMPSLMGADDTAAAAEAQAVSSSNRSLAGTAIGDAMMLFQLSRIRRRRGGQPAVVDPMEESLRRSARVDTLNLIEAAMRQLRAVTVGRLREKPAVLAVRVGTYGFEVLLSRPIEAPEGWQAASLGHVLELPPGVTIEDLDAAGQGPSLCPALVPVGDTVEGPLMLNIEEIGCLIVSGPGSPSVNLLNAIVGTLGTSPLAGDIRVITVGMDVPAGLVGWEKVHSTSFDSPALEELLTTAQTGSGTSLDVLVVGPGNDLLIQRAGQVAAAPGSRLALVGATSSVAARWPWRIHVDETTTAVVHPIACTMAAAQVMAPAMMQLLSEVPDPALLAPPRF